MKKILLTVLLLSLYLTSVYSQDSKKVLFIGNSYTFVNNLPQLLHDVALSHGDTLIFDSSTPGGFTFEGHSTYTATLNKINADNWDYVVLQEQSQRPSFPPSQVENEVLPFAETLVNLIRQNDTCTTPIFFMTWGRKNGDQQNCQYYPPICTYEGMQQRLRESYLLMAQLNNAEVAPVGAAWYQTRLNSPGIELYQADESHPSINGSYLAACVFYASLFHKNPVNSFYPANVTDTDAGLLQNYAKSIVLDSLANWFIDTSHVQADFDYVNNNTDIQFNNLSSNALSYFWDFGDGSFSYDENPIHTFQDSGLYSVMLIATKVCEQDTAFADVEFNPVSIYQQEGSSDYDFTISPNPAKQNLQLLCGKRAVSFEITNLKGELIRSGKVNSSINNIDVSNLNPAVYIFKLNFTDRNIQKKLIIL